MRQNEKGFTLLEVCMSLILFAIMLESLWGFFNRIYVEYIQFNRQVALNNEASIIQNYISEYIRVADKIRIITDKGTIQATGYSDNQDIMEAELKKIERTIKTPKAYGSGFNEEKSEITISRAEQGKGIYRLTYSVSGSSTKNLISDAIESIKVSSKQDSDLVVFECNLQKAGEINERLKINKVFTESIAYKEAYLNEVG